MTQGFWDCPNHYSPLNQVRISKFAPQMHFSTVKIPINSGIDGPWTSLPHTFLIQKLISLHCGGVHWDCETIHGLFKCCTGTVSVYTCAHGEHTAKVEWGLYCLIWIGLNERKPSPRLFHSMTVSQYDPCCAINWCRWPRIFLHLTPL